MSSDWTGNEIAIVGMAGRFPGAPDLDVYWGNLRAGRESVRLLTEAELREAGVAEALIQNPRYVRAVTEFAGADEFDADFFGLTPREAELLDPQHRLFLECAWQALEDAARDSERYAGRIGVFAGAGQSLHFTNFCLNPDSAAKDEIYAALMSSEKDFLSARVSYKLNLSGPSVSVQTSCSTSLSAVHLACQSLLLCECDMAVAGGVSLGSARTTGYLHQSGMIYSADGHCRAFDARASGTLLGRGVGAVILKRLADAREEGDRIRAIIRGSAMNNDGARKVSFMAPSVEGQARVIAEAIEHAGVDPETIGYVEAHGTGTPLGDPAEIAGLCKAFGARPRKGWCAIGSVKTNIGHLDAAAGMAGLIKTVLALEHGEIPPSLHFERPNPEIDFSASPFFVNDRLRPWQRGSAPRRAGVSAFGVGGTNVHLVLEEAPAPLAPAGPQRPWQLLPLAARTPRALDRMAENLARRLREDAPLDLADAAYTLQVGRRELGWRRAVLCRDAAGAAAALEGADEGAVIRAAQEAQERPVVFMFPGQGAQRINMGRELYEYEPAFRAAMDQCFEGLKAAADGLDFKSILYPSRGSEGADRELERTAVAQPALFAVEYALARLWMSWGVEPAAMIGHSVGEYVAACLSGALELGAALKLVVLRGALMEQQAPGAMLAVALTERELTERIRERHPEVALAAVNAPEACTVAGTCAAIEAIETELKEAGHPVRRLRVSRGFHSALMEPMLDPFGAAVEQIRFAPPRLPYVSNLTGDWIRAEQVAEAGYWTRHLRRTVLFRKGLETLFRDQYRVFLEVGPGRSLGGFVKRHEKAQAKPDAQPALVLGSTAESGSNESDAAAMLRALGRLWVLGVGVQWDGLHAGARPRRVGLPTYPFERRRYQVKSSSSGDGAPPASALRGAASATRSPGSWCYLPSWKPTVTAAAQAARPQQETDVWVLLPEGNPLAASIAQRLESIYRRVFRVKPGLAWRRLGECEFQMNPSRPGDYDEWVETMRRESEAGARIVHLWSLEPADAAQREPAPSGAAVLEEPAGFTSLWLLVQALGTRSGQRDARLWVVTDRLADLPGEAHSVPAKSTLLGLSRVIPQELDWLRCSCIDLPAGCGAEACAALAGHLVRELSGACEDSLVALRDSGRWVPTYERVAAPEQPARPLTLRQRGVYLITGGLGGIGLELAQYLARTVQARLVLVSRRSLPPRTDWERYLAGNDIQEPAAQPLARLLELEKAGGELLVAAADVADPDGMRRVVLDARARFGAIHGVIHAAGVPAAGMMVRKSREQVAEVLQPKVRGTLVLEELLDDAPPDFWVLCSSLASVIGGVGQADYCAANAFLDAWARRASRSGRRVMSLNWDLWQEVGMGARSLGQDGAKSAAVAHPERGLKPAEGVELFERWLDSGVEQVIISTRDLASLLSPAADAAAPQSQFEAARGAAARRSSRRERPPLATAFVAARDDVERSVAEIWEAVFGFAPVGIHDDFFELGGHSFMATQLAARIRDTFQLEVSVESIFGAPTVAQLAAVLVAADASPGRVARIASLAQRVRNMTESEVEACLAGSQEGAR